MKRIGLMLLSAALAGVGCLPFTRARDDHKPPPVQMKETKPPAPPPVLDDGITEKNAAERARQLGEELAHDARPGEPAKQ
jgi:hypothetical protein